jgi:ribosomal protein S18 acetylase RimI-like enzyme
VSSYQLRAADDQDREDLLRIHLAAMSAHLVAAFGEWSRAQAREHLDVWLRTGRAQVIVVDDVIAGLLDVAWRPDALHIVRIEIDPSFQGRGIGTRIVVDVLAEARRRSIPARLDVFIANPARRLYERLGFHEIGRDGPSVSMEWQPAAGAPLAEAP